MTTVVNLIISTLLNLVMTTPLNLIIITLLNLNLITLLNPIITQYFGDQYYTIYHYTSSQLG